MKKFFVLTALAALFFLLTAMKGGDNDPENEDGDKAGSSSKSQMAQNLLTHNNKQNHSTSIQQQLREQEKSATASPVPASGVKENVMLSNERPDANSSISFEVIDLSEKDNGEVMKELLTKQAEGKFYYRKVETEGSIDKTKLASAFDKLIEQMNMDSVREEKWKKKKQSWFTKDPMAKGKSEDKPLKYRITSSGDYEYYDGRRIVGSKKLKKSFEDNYKPLAELVFFYELRDKGLLKKDIGPRKFTSMDINEQRQVIKDVPIIESSAR